MTNLTHSYGHGKGYGNETLLLMPELCTLDTCDLSMASFLYIPTLPGNSIFAAIFGIYLVAQIYLGIKHKTWGYMTAMVMGLLLEIIGYVGRILLHNDPFSNDNFLIYLVTLTIAPALLSASVYLCLARIVNLYGENLSRFKPRTYTLFFVTCDIICLVLQALGGALASTADTESQGDLGKNIMMAGLVFQVVCLTCFATAATDFGLRVWKGKGQWNPRYLRIVATPLFKAFLIGLAVAVLTIFIRSAYRIAELSGGFNSHLFTDDEVAFMVLEGVMIIIACGCLTALHPAVCFQGVWHETNFVFRTSRIRAEKITYETGDEESQNAVQMNPLAARK
ncbi:related to YER185w, Rta1p [Rhynchosporium graminicola]|uniref:Related to YER185w, Rta1p n=2 Tax=Rhynchosporium TaxID=38037 RepID=A0A1E1M549_RHYSE|nr:related to YER185w, Rta1p [Rhynchosporium commune]CZT44220.1 related to YER185w, Rta1p [Rhynchosporium secalis]